MINPTQDQRAYAQAVAEQLDQTLYTTISHRSISGVDCSGCAEVTYKAGDDHIVIQCNECGHLFHIWRGEPDDVSAAG